MSNPCTECFQRILSGVNRTNKEFGRPVKHHPKLFSGKNQPNIYQLWWAARVSIPAPWDSSQSVRRRPSLSVCPGQWIMNVRRRPSISSRICCLGYTIGYITSGVGSPALSKFLTLMESKSRFVSKGQITEMVIADSDPGLASRARSGVWGAPRACAREQRRRPQAPGELGSASKYVDHHAKEEGF